MKRIFLFFLPVLFTLSCETDATIDASGNIVSDDRTTTEFNALDISSAFDVTVRQGDAASVVISADDNIISRVRTSVQNGILSVGLDNTNTNGATLRAEITMVDLVRAELSGAADLDVIDFACSGNLALDLSGASDANLTGSAPDLTLDLSGASEVNAFGFPVSDCEVSISGASEAEVLVSSSITGSLSGASELRFRGNPTTDVDLSGTSELVDAN